MQDLFDQPKEIKKTPLLTVSQITALIKGTLQNTLPPKLTITGQISGFKQHSSSGHCYFELKDESALLPTVMWKSDFAKLKFKPENGLAVICTGFIDIYPPQGKYQFYAQTMLAAGKGDLHIAFEQLKNKLEAEGLFQQQHKKQLPKYPFRIGIITSKSGAALHDIADGIFSRWPPAKIFLYDALVQGEAAAADIAKAIKYLNSKNKSLKLDLLIVGRGGGSMEDLWPFNEEIVARAIFNSKIPVISAVGHQTDFTIADFVADVRASTPTKAAVIAVPDIKEVNASLEIIQKKLRLSAQTAVSLCKEKLQTILAAQVFKNPISIAQKKEQALDLLQNTLALSAKNFLAQTKSKLQGLFESLLKIQPQRLIAQKTNYLDNAANQIHRHLQKKLAILKLDLESKAATLSACSHQATLKRGYAIAKTADGRIIKNLEQIAVNDIIITVLNDGTVKSNVIEKMRQ